MVKDELYLSLVEESFKRQLINIQRWVKKILQKSIDLSILTYKISIFPWL
jgi:hypothetical protein